MKISLALGRRQRLSRQTAWGCFMSNLALPGSGSLVAGRASGYVQLATVLIGMFLTTGFGLRFILWYTQNWSRLQQPENDPIATLVEIWRGVRWALLGIGIFIVGWLWALGTSMQIVQEARKNPNDE